MKSFTPEEVIRLNFLYDLLDVNYRGLREFSHIQRAALLHGSLPATVISNITLVAHSQAVCTAWIEIIAILNSPSESAAEPGDPDAAPESDDTAAPKKEIVH